MLRDVNELCNQTEEICAPNEHAGCVLIFTFLVDDCLSVFMNLCVLDRRFVWFMVKCENHPTLYINYQISFMRFSCVI